MSSLPRVRSVQDGNQPVAKARMEYGVYR
jgi:hypothetical protein